jgi:hypothetical protein
LRRETRVSVQPPAVIDAAEPDLFELGLLELNKRGPGIIAKVLQEDELAMQFEVTERDLGNVADKSMQA